MLQIYIVDENTQTLCASTYLQEFKSKVTNIYCGLWMKMHEPYMMNWRVFNPNLHHMFLLPPLCEVSINLHVELL